MAFEGDLSHLALGDVLQTLAMSRQMGTFILRSPAEERRLLFGPRGAGLLTVKQSLRTRVGEYLRGKGKVDPGAYDDALKTAQRRKDITVEDVLLETGCIGDAEVAEARRYAASEEIHDLFLWTQGAFEFISEDATDQLPFGGAWFDVASIAMEAARRMDEASRLEESVPRSEVFCCVDGVASEGADVGIDAVNLLALADGTRTVEGILDQSYLGRFDTWKALESLRQAGLIRAASPDETFDAAARLVHSHDYAGAASLLRRVLELNPEDAPARRDLIQALTLSGDKRAASREWVQIARRAEEAGEVAAAIDAWRQAVRLDKDNPEAQDGCALVLLGSGDLTAGVEAARAATLLHVDARNFPAAIAIAEAAVRACPDDAGMRICLANAHIAAGSPADALLFLDDSAALLEQQGAGEMRRLLDVYRRILQLDPSRRDCARRVDEIESTERYRRRRLLQRLAIVGGIVVVALAVAIPTLRRPSFEQRLETVREAILQDRAEDARRELDALEESAGGDDELLQVRGMRELLATHGARSESQKYAKRLQERLDHLLKEAFEARGRDGGWTLALKRYDEVFEVLEGPDGKALQPIDAGRFAECRRDVLADVDAGLSWMQAEAGVKAATVTAARDRFLPAVFKDPKEDVLADLVERTAAVKAIRESQDWPAVLAGLGAVHKRVPPGKDEGDAKLADSVKTMIDGFEIVEREGARALAALRKVRLLQKRIETHGRGQELLGTGKIEEAQRVCESFLEACEEIRRAEPRELYERIVHDVIEGFDMERPVRERLAQIQEILDAESAAADALGHGDAATAFTLRVELVRKHGSVDFRERFQLPLKIESRPTGAMVVAHHPTDGARELGRTPLLHMYPLETGAELSLVLDGYEAQPLTRRGAVEDESGTVTIELPKRPAFAVTGTGGAQATPVAWEDRVVLAGRDGRVRVRSTRDGKELAPAFDTGSIEGVAASPAVHGGRIFVATLDGAGFVLDGATLTRLHTFRFDGKVRAALLETTGGVVSVTESGTAQLLGPDGTALWTTSVGPVRVDPVLAGRRAVFVTTAADLVALDASNGREEFRIRLPDDPRWGAPETSPAGDRAWVVSDGGIVACVDLSKRRVVWKQPIGSPVSARATWAGSRLLVVTTAGSLHSFDAATGEVVRREVLGGPSSHRPLSLPFGCVATTDRGVVLHFDAAGTLVWKYDAKDDLAAPVTEAGGRVVVLTKKGMLIALRP